MKVHEKNNVTYFTFDIFSKFEEQGILKHCFSSRLGGVSTGVYSSLNLNFSNGDERINVNENFTRICEAVGFLPDNLVFSNQVHSTGVYKVCKDDAGKGFNKKSDIHEMDALMTDATGVVLTTFYADCVPLYFYDPVKKVIALSHSGWKGTLNGIGKITIEEMKKAYGCSEPNILVGIGPSIGGCCFETGDDVAGLFLEQLPFSKSFVRKGRFDGKYYIDLWQINKVILLNAGIKEENIEISGLCTMCKPSLFFSHRLLGVKRGSMAAFLALESV